MGISIDVEKVLGDRCGRSFGGSQITCRVSWIVDLFGQYPIKIVGKLYFVDKSIFVIIVSVVVMNRVPNQQSMQNT